MQNIVSAYFAGGYITSVRQNANNATRCTTIHMDVYSTFNSCFLFVFVMCFRASLRIETSFKSKPETTLSAGIEFVRFPHLISE